ncbi:MAG: 2-oxo acid dehydrogenase subunit E2 [Gammaproteobacteria bacterium]|nr:2-oxo acid dehydrogenase subunit E2 [Gammaproteobacteria bacterium]
MIDTLVLPNLGEGIESGTVIQILVGPGDVVTSGQTLFELEIDKVNVDIPSAVAGTVKEILVASGDEVVIGRGLASIETAGPADAPTSPGNDPTNPAKEARPLELKDTATPRLNSPPPSIVSKPVGYTEATGPVPAGPGARRMARELGVEIRQVPGSGMKGRIGKQDVINFARQLLTARAKAAQSPAPPSRLPDLDRFGKTERTPLTHRQRTVARNMTRAWREIPHAWLQDRIDITELEFYRNHLNAERSDDGTPVSVTAFLVDALARNLKSFPLFNASLDTMNDEIVYRKAINIGVAVDTSHSLMVPVIRHADTKPLHQIAAELTDLANRARQNTLEVHQLQGAGMTLTNLGHLDVDALYPIIDWPQSAILGVASARWEKRRDDQGDWHEHLSLPVTLAIDHRIIQGADGVRFLGGLKNLLERIKRGGFE